ncbi:formylglycine-generating enzyme family protein [Puniceibacterium confluentis]|uniref:formylglycine-generating enzyme family protein n=1 Tax=Puniceibacterium confluentis TaxID=1958944 RepID=UPI0011B78DAA|nr:formylglycine-generating enzyme family protein [Puniceibacterium confluentis]
MHDDKPSCCAPGSNPKADDFDARFEGAASEVPEAPPDIRSALRDRLESIEGGFFDMGARRSSFPDDLDSPRRRVRVSPFRIAPHAVTNVEYAAFVDSTGYRTVAEQEGWSYVFHLFLDDLAKYPDYAGPAPWWRRVDGACWSAPGGPRSDWQDRPDHPVVQIAWYDAFAYCRWAGLRLPREAEWEFAARGGLARKKFPWGNEMMPGGVHAMNTWQGEFPAINTAEDGWVGTAPVGSYPPNGYGLYDMTGNVWEWVQDYYGPRPDPKRLAVHDPTGPETGTERIQRGGSYLCHISYCDRYHVHSRTRNDPSGSAGNSGFRVAGDA